jgi:hypothetical protein
MIADEALHLLGDLHALSVYGDMKVGPSAIALQH